MTGLAAIPDTLSRDSLVDALRGMALFGILAVNIQCYLLGIGSSSLGILDAHSSAADHAVVLFTGFFLHYKFYPIFCFCFGYGFAVQTRRWIAQGRDASALTTRRTNFLLATGVLHGIFLWFGDILTSYALAGKVLARHIGKGPRRLIPVLKFWLVMFLVVAIPVTILFAPDLWPSDVSGADSRSMADDARRAFDVYSGGTYLDALNQRAVDYLLVVSGFVFILPEVMLLFLLGTLCAQLGLVRRRQHFAAIWKRILGWALAIGIPVNLWHAWAMWNHAQQPWQQTSLIEALPADFAPILSVAYVATLVLIADTRGGRALIALFAPAGRLALSNYVAQSVAMAVLLSGFGFGLGRALDQPGLLGMALAIYLMLLVVSIFMARRRIAGPLESAWRRYTNAG